MKAERRHELKTNTLARGIEGVPNFWREHGNQILLIVLVAAVTFLLVRYWNEKKAKDAASVAINLQTAHTELGMLTQLPFRMAEGASRSESHRRGTRSPSKPNRPSRRS